MLSDDYYKKDREKYLKRILECNLKKKLIIAGPGTGKTYTFKKLLERYRDNLNRKGNDVHKKGLVITFIRNLVSDLDKELGNLAEVRTFHSFCRSEMIKIKGRGFEYYPHLLSLIKEDIYIIEPSFELRKNESLDNYFYALDEKIINKALEVADYYNAGGHTDSVYMVYKYYKTNPSEIPKYSIVLVDEYQDFNLLETKLVEKLSEKNHILIVGDDDQALYTFRKSSPEFLRSLTNDKNYVRFDLPYCSRCPEVIINAVNKIIEISKKKGYLKGRIEKPFKYYPPDKRNDSINNPEIIRVHCSVERKNCHYAAKFILNELISMPQEYKEDAIRKNEPAALVIGPRQFLDQVRAHFEETKGEITQQGWIFTQRKEQEDKVNVLDGYEILMRNRRSNLGWRIVLGIHVHDEVARILKNVIRERRNIVDCINKETLKYHYQVLEILIKIRNGDDPNNGETNILANLGLSLDEVISRFSSDGEKNGTDTDHLAHKPRIFCTTFEGSKGLAAQYVFILGFNEGHFPKNNPPSNIDICRLIVALTRTRRRAYIVSYGHFGGSKLKESIFLSYLDGLVSKKIYVSKKYFFSRINV